MELREIADRMNAEIGRDTVVTRVDSKGSGFHHLVVSPKKLKPVLGFCLHDSAMRFDMLECIFAVDTGHELEVCYQLFSTTLGHRLNIKTNLDLRKPKLSSATGFWRAAYAYELETAEMFGVSFDGHPDMTRHLFLADDWVGYPLRKEYVFPKEYGGIAHEREPLTKEHAKP